MKSSSTRGDSTVSSKYQIVIPKTVREHLHIQPGQRVTLSVGKGSEIILVPAKAVEDYYGLWVASEDPVAYQRQVRRDKHYA